MNDYKQNYLINMARMSGSVKARLQILAEQIKQDKITKDQVIERLLNISEFIQQYNEVGMKREYEYKEIDQLIN